MLANFITGSRIIFSLAMLTFPVFSAGFYFCYMLAGFTDMIDGTIAHILGTESKFGRNFDTIADTGCTLKEALRASHAKSWKDYTSDAELLNVYNGFLLTANLDALFDKGYISFTDDGLLMLSSAFSFDDADMRGLGIHSDMKLRWVEDRHLEFLDYHHKKVWKN